MNRKIQDLFYYPMPPAFVVNQLSPDEVANAIINGGRQTEPFYIFDMDEAHRHVQRFRAQIPRVKMFYAMKANDSEIMVRLAVALGLGFDCASPVEISRIVNLNVCPTSIIYAVPTKTPEQMIFAREAGVRHTTFDSSCELKKLKQYWPDAKLLIRLRVDSESVYKLALKFGCDFNTEALDLLEEAASLGLHVVGVAFHVGSACFTKESYIEGIRYARALFDHEAKAGREMKILDIGGGFFCDSTDRFDQVSVVINSALEEMFPDPSVQVIAEPGRYLCESSFTLYCNINNVRTVMKHNEPINMVYLSDGIHGTLRSYEQWHTVRKLNNSELDTLEATVLCGPTLDPRDQMPLMQLPPCTTQDWLVFTMQGAYTFSFSGRYSGFEVALIRPIISTSLWTLVRDNPVFSTSDFIASPDISTPLPSTMPPLLFTDDVNQSSNYHLPSLID